MKFRARDLRQVKATSPLYRIDWFINPTERDIMSFCNSCRRYAKEYPNVSWFIAISENASDTSVKQFEKTGKKGRPKVIINGKKANLHVHQGAIGIKGNSAYSYQIKVAKALNRRAGRKVTHVSSMKGLDYINYSYKQAKSFQTGGNFDFMQCADQFFMVINE